MLRKLASLRRSALAWFTGGEKSDKAIRIAMAGVVALGTWLRVRAHLVDPPTLWLDEAYWAVNTITRSALDAQIRPFGFMQVTKWLHAMFGATELVFRLLPLLGSLAALWAMPFVALRLFESRLIALLAVFLLAVNRLAIEMAVEFKHYGLEMGVMIVLLAVYLVHRKVQQRWSLGLMLALAWAAFPFSLAVIFFYPGLFALLAWEAFSLRKWYRLLAVAGTAIACIATILAVYLSTWKGISQPKAEKKWGTYYGVFYLEGHPKEKHGTRLEWSVEKYFDMTAFPNVDRERWHSDALSRRAISEIATVDYAFWCVMYIAGLYCLVVRKRYEHLILLWTPLLVLMLFNFIGRWPAGAFRTNGFYLPYALLMSVLGIDWVAAGARGWKLIWPSLAGVVAVVPSLLLRPHWEAKGFWAAPGAFREALEVLVAGAPKGEGTRTILLDNNSCRPWSYYVEHDSKLPEQTRRALRKFRTVCARSEKSLTDHVRRLAASKRDARFSVILTKRTFFEPVETAARRHCPRLEASTIGERTHLVLRCDDPPAQ